jgi:hypothetical protein
LLRSLDNPSMRYAPARSIAWWSTRWIGSAARCSTSPAS